MTELRLDPLRRRWIVTGKRPSIPEDLDSGALCAFCPGNERFTPKAICERHSMDGAWMSRVFPDRAPLFRVEEDLGRTGEGLFDRMNAVGAHEIVVETPRHGVTFAGLTDEEAASAIGLWRDRILDLKQDRRLRYVSVFKHQRGPQTGHEGHGHSQILATPIIPLLLEMEFRWSLFQFERKERCLCCDMIEQEVRASKRVVDETGDFIALCPYASRAPYELLILPRNHASAFERDVDEAGRVRALAEFLKMNLRRIEDISPALQLIVHTEPNLAAPVPTQGWWKSVHEDFHWHIEITPHLDGGPPPLGAEGFYFNPISAEEAATVLRALNPSPGGGASEA